MADDKIDIEEHDILDNPVVRRMFPDISVLKKEVLDFDDEVLTEEIPAKYPASIKDDYNRPLPCFLSNVADQVTNAKFTRNNFTQIDKAEKYPTIIIDDTNVTSSFQSGKLGDQINDMTSARNNSTQINDTDEYPTIVIDETNDTLSFHSSKQIEIIDSIFAQNNLNQRKETEKCPLIVIDDANITLSHHSSKLADQAINSKPTEVICKQRNKTEKYLATGIDESNITLLYNSSKIVDEVTDANDLNESEKRPPIVIKETYMALPNFSSKPANQDLDANNPESNFTQLKETEKYSMIESEGNKVMLHCDSSKCGDKIIQEKSRKSNFTQVKEGKTYLKKVTNAFSTNLPHLLKPAEQGYSKQFSQTNVRRQNYENKFSKRMKTEISTDTKKTFTNDVKVKPFEQNGNDVPFLQQSKNVTCSINEEKCNKVYLKPNLFKFSKSMQKKNTLLKQKNRNSVNLDRQLLQGSNQHGNRIRLPVTSNAKSSPHSRKNSQFEQWQGNKIILGSKSSAIKSQNKVSATQNISNNVRVLVENLGTFLSKSTRYCKKCFILFPSNKTLADHRDLIHSQVHNNQSTKSQDPTISEIEKPSNHNKKYKCNVCGREFISSSNLLKHKRCVHSLHIKKWKRMENLNQSIQPQMNLNEGTQFRCTHCNESFPSQQVLIDHMYNILQNKQNKNGFKSNLSTQKVHTRSPVFYRCPFCSYYFIQKNNYVKHLRNKHKTADNINLEKVEFDSICNYCYGKYSEIKSFNVHVWKRHLKKLNYVPKNIVEKGKRRSKYKKQTQSTVKNNKDSTTEEEQAAVKANMNDKLYKKHLLKSVFFKCVKCNICFLSGEKAANHIEHELTRTKWKCSKCSQIFNEDEQNRHAHQHLFCDNFEVVEMSEDTYVYLLFKCPNCASYFRELDFFCHYSLCEMQSPDSAYCKTCHILIDNNIKELHEIHHYMEGGKKLNNILIESDVITYEEIDNKVKEPFDLPMAESGVKQSNYISHERSDDKIQNKLKLTYDRSNENNLTDSVINSDLYIDYAEKRKREIETKDFSGKRRTTTIVDKPLRFMYCCTCKAFIFVSTVRKLYNHIKGRCINLTNYVCKYCGLVLSTKTIDSHRKLHQDVPNLTLNDLLFFDLRNGKQISPPVPKYPNCHLCGKHFITKTAIISHICSEDYLKCPLCNIKLSKNAFSLHTSFHKYSSKPKSKISLEDLSIRSKESHPNSETELPHLLESRNTNLEDKYLLVYICKICKVAVDSYDTVIEHCHYHISNQEKEIMTKLCDLCNLIFIDTCFLNHKMLHSCNQNKKFSSLTYDAFYVTAVDQVWLNHLFGSLSKNVINNILKNSIYNIERKIKMQILQHGSPDLTFYKCAKCNSVVDPSCLYDHCRMDILCYKSKIVSCPVCGILMSDEFLMKHEKIHETQDITSVLYRFVLFNCNDDKTINQALRLPHHYILYECRNCNGIVDRKQFQHHKCNFDDLSKCSHCGLLLYNNDYMPHVVKHKEFCSFQESNMIVILIGAVNEEETLTSRYKSSFQGIKLDYLFYKCNSCQVCHKDKQSSLTHNCSNLAKTKCVPCDLYFEDSSFKKHRKLHESDPYFSKENVTILELDLRYSRVSRPNNVDVIVIEDEEDLNEINDKTVEDDQLHGNNNSIDSSDIVEKYDEIFRCDCGLHFITEANALSHITKCNNTRYSKQTCPKCGLLFKPNVLYSHLLKHHGTKGVSYKFNITPISKKSRIGNRS